MKVALPISHHREILEKHLNGWGFFYGHSDKEKKDK